ncbi:hypothetical protein BFRIPC_00067 (plasmid) [Peribacillus frigoritolerans]
MRRKLNNAIERRDNFLMEEIRKGSGKKLIEEVAAAKGQEKSPFEKGFSIKGIKNLYHIPHRWIQLLPRWLDHLLLYPAFLEIEWLAARWPQQKFFDRFFC